MLRIITVLGVNTCCGQVFSGGLFRLLFFFANGFENWCHGLIIIFDTSDHRGSATCCDHDYEDQHPQALFSLGALWRYPDGRYWSLSASIQADAIGGLAWSKSGIQVSAVVNVAVICRGWCRRCAEGSGR